MGVKLLHIDKTASSRQPVHRWFFGRQPYRLTPVRGRPVAFRLQASLLVLALGAASIADGQVARPEQRNAASNQAAAPFVRTGVALSRGQELHYEIVDGLAVHGGDMVLGPVEEVVAEQPRRPSTKVSTGSWPDRRDLAAVEDELLWPDGIIPYVIEAGFTEKALSDIELAIQEWNTKTVITLVQRTTESDYVRFLPRGFRPSEPYCRANLGRKGGEQSIWLSGPDGCGVDTTIHEIGHAVGLVHEHQRHDRDQYITVADAQSYGDIRFAYLADTPGRRPYDYSSVMNYIQVGTIPPGIPLRSGGLSPGDIDGVARLYGTVPTTTTISTNPAGLTILVDGERVTTPAQFDWSPGSTHTLNVISPQTVGAERFVFGRWSDEGRSRRTVTAGPESTWFEANYIAQRRVLSCAAPSEAGSVTVRPGSRDGFHVQRQPIEVEATADGSSNFLQWNPVPGLRRGADRHSRGSVPGASSSPASGATPFWSYWSSRGTGINEFCAIYTEKPTFLVASNIDGIRIDLGGEPRRIPWAFPADAYPGGIWAEAPASVPEEADFDDIRYRFKGWSDGGSRAHRIEVPASGGSVDLEFTREYRLRVASRNHPDDADIDISPPSEDGFYADGTQVQVAAMPGSGWHFAGWIGEFSNSGPVQTIVMDAAKTLEAVFAESEPIRPGETKNVTLRASEQFHLYSGSEGYNLLVPPDAAEVTVRFQSSSAAEVDLYVHQGGSVRWEPGDSGETPLIHADFESTSPGATETISIHRESVPRLSNNVYFIGLAVPPTPAQIEGTLSVEVRRGGIVKAWPPALTFVSAADPQTLRLTHETTGSVRYKIVSNADWLTANPQEWVRSGSGVEEISVIPHTTGAVLLNATYRGSLTVLKASDGPGETTWHETGIEIPVVSTVASPYSSSRHTSRWANAVTIDSRPQDSDTYGAGEEIRVSVSFTDPVEVSGTPELDLAVGDRTRRVPWIGNGSTSVCEAGYKSLEFSYLVQAEDRDADGIGIAADALTLNGGTIETAGGVDSTLALAGPVTVSAPDHKIDGSMATVPKVSNVGISSSPSNGSAYGAGEPIVAWVQFSTRIEVAGSPRLELTVGSQRRQASFWAPSREGTALFFRYQVQSGDVDTDGIGIVANALTLNGGSIRSAVGADADLGLGAHAIVKSEDHKVDGSLTRGLEVSGVGIYSSPSNGTAYRREEFITVRIQFTSRVEVTGSPRLALTVGSQTRHASYWAPSRDGTTLFFRYQVQSEDMATHGIGIAANALTLNGGSIRSEGGTDADLGLGAHAALNFAGHKVDGSIAIAPEVSGVGIFSSPSNGTTYRAREFITVWVQFTSRIEATGRPRLALTVGSQARHASYWAPSRDRTALYFRYLVRSGDVDTDGIGIAANALTLNGGSIRSAGGTAAVLDLGAHAITDAADHKVDGGGG